MEEEQKVGLDLNNKISFMDVESVKQQESVQQNLPDDDDIDPANQNIPVHKKQQRFSADSPNSSAIKNGEETPKQKGGRLTDQN